MQNSDFLKNRADAFFASAKEQIAKERYFLAAFHFEQAAQLYLKHCLFIKLKDFPKTHPLDELLRNIGKSYDKAGEAEEFLKEHSSVIGDLNQSYITSRYLPADFNIEQTEAMSVFVGNLVDFLKKLCPKF